MTDFQNIQGFIRQLEAYKEAFIEDMRSLERSENTIKTYSKEIDIFIEFAREYDEEMEIEDINRPFIMEAIRFRSNFTDRGEISNATKKLFLSALKAYFLFISDVMPERKDFMSIFRKIKIKSKKRQKEHLTDSEVNNLLNYLERTKNKTPSLHIYRNTLLIKLMLYAGLRISEALSLKHSDFILSDIDKDLYIIKITGKGDKEEFVYVKTSLVEDELEYIKKYFPGEDRIMLTRNKKPLKPDEAYRMIKRYFNKVGIKKSGLHIFRHTLGFRLADRGVPIEDIQDILRHSNINTTRIYVNRTAKHKIDAINKLYKK
jgi:integrase/recombinase XerD